MKRRKRKPAKKVALQGGKTMSTTLKVDGRTFASAVLDGIGEEEKKRRLVQLVNRNFREGGPFILVMAKEERRSSDQAIPDEQQGFVSSEPSQ